MPYFYGAAVEAHEQGLPVMRPMVLEFPADPACDTLDRQYLLGESLLVAPVFTYEGMVDYYVPAGRWTHLLTGEVIEGGRWRREQHDFLSLPLLVRPNTALAVGDRDDRPDYDFSDGFTLRVYQLDNGATAKAIIPAADGAATVIFSVQRSGQTVTVSWQGAPNNWRVQLIGVASLASAAGGSAVADPAGVVVTPAAGATALTLTLGNA
jgi:alpha-D-xyloside xylohydrolase